MILFGVINFFIMVLKIEKNIPAPEWIARNHKYPFKEMEIGDSFNCGKYSRDNMKKLYTAARQYKFKNKIDVKFRCSRLDNGTFRMWRVK